METAVRSKEHRRGGRGGGKGSRSLVVIANRLPVRRSGRNEGKGQGWQTSPGGLVSAVAPMVQRRKGVWVGWAGMADKDVKPFEHDGIRMRPVSLSESDLEQFYYGLSNATLWPLYHDAIRPPEFRRRWWRSYVEINQRFAECAAAAAGDSDVVWIHDYHLQLVPGMLRALKPRLRIGFFLHIPFPPQELFARLPWRTQILEGLLGADVIGFQTRLSAQNFSRVARRYTTCSGTDRSVHFNGRTVRVDAFPISIDVAKFEHIAARDDVVERARDIRHSLGPQRAMFLGVDRLDYTKGIDVRLQAFQELLSRGHFTVRDCVFHQIAVPSREIVADYADLRSRVEEMVGRINGQFAEPGRVAVHYLRRNLPHEELVAFYLAADVMVVTPFRDGMNLVAKEYAATRLDNSGVLILSEFAGAADEFRSATLVNPYDVDGIASAFESALQRSPAHSRRRMRALRSALARNNVYDWADSFLGTLTQ